MTTKLPLHPLVGYLHRLAKQSGATEATDCQLLARFARERDEAAFRALVTRHGALVLGVCTRALRHRQDAEDAFQATFLVLAKKAGAVRWQHSVAGWLHATASRVAAEMRVRDGRRRRREEQVAAARGTTAPAGDSVALRELGAILDEELSRLPDVHRTPLLLCYCQGRTRDQVARILGLPLRTLERRLCEGRTALEQRLARRGVTLTAAFLAGGLAQDALAAVPNSLATATAASALGFATGSSVAVSARVLALAVEAARRTLWQPLSVATGLVLAAGLLVMSAGFMGETPLGGFPEGAPAPADDGKASDGDKPPAAQRRASDPQSVRAVAAGLDWLAQKQEADGRWKLEGTPNDVAATALALWPLLKGSDDSRAAKPRPHGGTIERGLRYLVRVQKEDGSFEGGMYAHALAAIALCEGRRLNAAPGLKERAQRALDFIVEAQHEAGGWRYTPRQPGDMSVTSWHITALKRGEGAGLRVPAEVFRKASAFLDSVASDEGSVYGYVSSGQGSAAMTAAGLWCRQLLGWGPESAALQRGAVRLAQSPPTAQASNAYHYHYATLALRGAGGPSWQLWEPKIRQRILDTQENGGADKGSWSPAGDPFGQGTGRIYVTSLTLLTLQACGQSAAPAVEKKQD
jgi:RNA polymerase sigma factor (sigma-70 family)